MKVTLYSVAILGILFLGLITPSVAIIIRHDRDDSHYRDLAAAYPQVVHMNTQELGKPPDGEGTLVDSYWVATAAHIASLIKPGHKVTAASVDYVVEAVHIHPAWTDGPNDIALVRLARKVVSVEPVRIYRERDEVGKLITLVGIGDTGTGLTGPTSNDGQLRAATNRIDTVSDAWLKFKFDHGDAATDQEGIGGPGDSGGPAFIDINGVRYLVGVSSGQSTLATEGREGLYGVTEYYTRISSYASWLDSIMSKTAHGK